MGFLFGKKTQINNTASVLSGVTVQNSSQGVPIPVVYGKTRITGNNLWYGDFTAIPHTDTQSSGGGKGGGGGVSTTTTTYTYQVAIEIGLCEGPINGVGTIWQQKNIVSEASLGLTEFTGSYTQVGWSYLTTNHPGQDLGYRGIAYEATAAFELGNSSSLPNLSFEVKGFGYTDAAPDVNPAVILSDILTNAKYGANFPSAQLGDLTAFSTYCAAVSCLISPAYATQAPASGLVASLMRIGNSAPIWSEGVLKVVPYADEPTAGGISGTWVTKAVVAGNFSWNSIVWNGSIFCAVGDSNGVNSHVMTSPDGITWTARTAAGVAADAYFGIAWNGYLFVAVGYNTQFSNGICMTSPDGVTWTNRTMPVCITVWKAVVWSGSQFVAVGTRYAGSPTGAVVSATSPDGITWTGRTIPEGDWIALAYSGSVYVAVATNQVATSPDGITWTLRISAGAQTFSGVAWNGSLFAIISTSASSAQQVLTSPDGITWTVRASANNNQWACIAYINGVFVAGAGSGAGNRTMTSPDGITWTIGTSSSDSPWTAMATNNAVLVMVARGASTATGSMQTPLAAPFRSGVLFTPNTTINYNLTDDDFIAPAGEPPVTIRRTRPADAKNYVQVQCVDRANNYNNAVTEAIDQASINAFGLLPMNMVSIPEIALPAVGQQVAQTLLIRSMYYLNEYSFTLGWKYSRLEPMDLVSLTDSALPYSQFPVRITAVEEDADGNLKMTAEDFMPGTSVPLPYSPQASSGYINNFNVNPGNSV